MNPRTLQLAAWASLALVAFAALAPIELRPTSSMPPTVERFAAFAAVGFAFALAYPRHFWTAALTVIVATFLLEALQVLQPSRHGRLADALVKLTGGAGGLIVGWILIWWDAKRMRAAERTEIQASLRRAKRRSSPEQLLPGMRRWIASLRSQ